MTSRLGSLGADGDVSDACGSPSLGVGADDRQQQSRERVRVETGGPIGLGARGRPSNVWVMSHSGWRQWADESMEQVDRQVRDAQRRAEEATRFRASMDQVQGRATSLYRDVSAATDVNGRLVDLQLTSDALRRDPRDLARLVVSTVDAARRNAGSQALTVARDAFGADSAIVTKLAAELKADGS